MNLEVNQFLHIQRKTPYLRNHHKQNNNNDSGLNLNKIEKSNQKQKQKQQRKQKTKIITNNDIKNNPFENKNKDRYQYQTSSQNKLKKINQSKSIKSKKNTVLMKYIIPQQNVYNYASNINRQKNEYIIINENNRDLYAFRKQKGSADVRSIQNKNHHSSSYNNLSLSTRNQNKTYYFDNNNNNNNNNNKLTYEDTLIRPQFYIKSKRPQQTIQSQMQKLNRRKLFNRVHTQNIKNNYNYNPDKLQTVLQKKIRQDKQKHPAKYLILGRQAGLEESQIYKMKPSHLDFQLQRFIKNKGLEYLEDNKLKSRAKSGVNILRSKIKDDQNPQKKYKNYIPEVFSKLKPKKKDIPVIQKIQKKPSIQLKPPLQSKIEQKVNKLNALSSIQDKLGKQIVHKVKKHIKSQKQIGHRYYDIVKSQSAIDQKLIEFLRAKIDRAQVTLS